MKRICLGIFTLMVFGHPTMAGETARLATGECALAVMHALPELDHYPARSATAPLPAPEINQTSPSSQQLLLWGELTSLLSEDAKRVLETHANASKPTTIMLHTGSKALQWAQAATQHIPTVALHRARLGLDESTFERIVCAISTITGLGCAIPALFPGVVIAAEWIVAGIAYGTGYASGPAALTSAVLFPPAFLLGLWGSAAVFVSIDNWSGANYNRRIEQSQDPRLGSDSFSRRVTDYFESDSDDTLISDLTYHRDLNGSYNIRYIAGRVPAEYADKEGNDQILIVIVQAR